MRKIVLLVLVSSFVMAGMSGWSQETEEEKAAKIEAARICQIYKDKTDKYKETMRDDDMARATLKNYIRIENKYCVKVHG